MSPDARPLGHAGRPFALLLAAVLALLAGGFAGITAEDHADTLEDGWLTAERAAHGAAEHAERSLAAARLVTERVAETVRRDGAEVFRGPEGQARLVALAAPAPQIGSVWVLDAEGRLRASSVDPAPPASSFADRPYYAPLRAGRAAELTPMLRARLTPVWFFSYNLGVRDASGAFLGIVQAAMHAEEFQRFQRGLGLGPEGQVGLFRAADGAALMLHPLPARAGPAGDPPIVLGTPADALRQAAASGAAAGGRFEQVAPDGRRFLIAWQRAEPDGAVIATAAMPRQAALAPFLARLLRNALLFGLAGLVVTGLGGAVAAALARGAAARRVAEAGRRELAAVLEATGDGVIALDRDWRITLVNRRGAAAIAGGRELRGAVVWDAFPGLAGSAFEAAYRATMADRRPATAEAVYAPFGRRFRVESHPREDGGIVIFFRDVTAERQAALRLAESEARLRQLFHAIDEGYCLCEIILDAQGRPADYRFLEVNPLFAPMTGLADPVGRTALELVPDLEPHWIETYGRVALQGETLRFQQGSDALGRWFDVFATPVAPRGRFALVFRDVTARRKAEQALRETEERLRRAQEAGGVGLWEWDAGTRQTFWSAPQRRLLGVGEEVTSSVDTFATLIHPDDLPGFLDAFRAALKTPGLPFAAEFRIRRADTGEERWLAARGEAERDAAGRVTRMVGVNLDITARRAAEAALAESEARLRLAQEAAEVGVFEQDVQTGRAHWSPAMFRLYGIDPAGRGPWLSLDEFAAMLHPADQASHRAWREAMLADPAQTRFEFEFRIRRPDTGEVRWVASRGEVVRDAAGAALLLRGINHDVTARRRAEERQMLLAREVDHRARNALAVVQSIIGLTRDTDPERFRAAVTGRIAAMARAHTLLANEGWDGAGLWELVEAEVAPYRGASPGFEERVTLHGPPVDLGPEAAQPLAMALHELATNAAKYGALSGPEGRVSISWQAGEGGALLLRWQEEGGPTLRGPPERRGFGSSVIRNTVERQLGGKTAFAWPASGLDCTLTLPAAHLRWPEVVEE